MTKLGIMTLNPLPIPLSINQIKKHCLEEEVTLFVFSPLSIDPYSEKVTGYEYAPIEDSWHEKKFPIPNLIYDRCIYALNQNSQQAKRIVQWLKQRQDTVFIGYGLPDKWKTQQALQKNPVIAPYLIPTERVTTADEVISFLQIHPLSVLKPVDGAGGHGVYGLTLDTQNITIIYTRDMKSSQRTLPLPSFTKWINNLLKKHDFIVQKKIQSLSKNNEPFDIRIFLQKEEKGKWISRGAGIRCGKEGSLLTNLHAGAELVSIKDWKQKQKHLLWDFIMSEIREVIAKLPSTLEETFAPLFEVGLDILIGEDSSIWICDINSKPGRTLIEKLYPDKSDDISVSLLRYSKHLERNWVDRSPLI
ncbi:YheC/YheD family endospore coat-associated protein [Bacillus sp. 2205SS5-2]|uniref:YheC/YheD family endospore coat-associated protein n=1 Tax=Bacillus sp. 2205SS5-2 TaxID=3109031 RepID=UPI003004FCD4